MLKKRKIVSILTAAALLLTMFIGAGASAAPAAATDLSDINGHWAQSSIETLVAQGIVSGYPDGTFQPDKTVTRAEFISMVNQTFGFTDADTINYTDVKSSDWFAPAIAIAQKAGYISGYPDGSIKPNDQVSRQEVAAIISNVLKLVAADTSSLAKFTDAASIPTWSANAVAAMVEAGYLSGYPDGSFKASEPTTRAMAAVILSKAKAQPQQQQVFDKAGTYGPATGTNTIDGNVTISAAGVALQNTEITGNLLIAESVGDGNVTLKNITVKGTTTINGGGAHSVIIDNSDLGNVISNKRSVHISCVNGTVIATITLNNGATIDVAAGASIAGVRISTTGEVTLDGNFSDVTVDTPNANLTVNGGRIDNLTITDDADNADIYVATGAKVDTLTLNAVSDITGNGSIDTANYNVNGCTTTIAPDNENTGSGVTAPEPTTTSGGGGGSTSSAPRLSNVKIGDISADIDGKVLTFALDLNVAYTTGTATLSKNADYTIHYGTTDITAAALDTDNMMNIVLTALDAEDGTTGDGVIGSTLILRSPVTLTLKTGSLQSIYTLVFTSSVDKTALTTAIRNAANLLDSTSVGTAPGNVPQAAYDLFSEAITQAAEVKDDAIASQTEVDDQVTALANATTVFYSSIIGPVPPAPPVLADDMLNIIIGINSMMEYQIDSGAWTAYTGTDPDLSGEHNVLVRFKANGIIPAGETTSLNFTVNPGPPAPPAPTVTADDENNVILGIDTTMEYQIDSGAWTAYTGTDPDLSGDHNVLVRVKANGIIPAGETTSLNFTVNPGPPAPPAPTVTADDENNVILGIDTTMEYQIDSGAWTAYTGTDPDLSGDHNVLVRVKADGIIPAGETTSLNFTTNPVPTGTYTITQINMFSAGFSVTISNLSNANYFNVYRISTLVNPDPVEIDTGLNSMPAVYSTISSLEVWVYSDSAGTNKIAEFTLSGDEASGTLDLK